MKKELKVKVKFFSETNGGRKLLPKDLLSVGTYRPHFVVGDPEQRKAIINKNNTNYENYLGVAFIYQQGTLKAEKEIEAVVVTIYPEVDYSSLVIGATFTIQEGHHVVGKGEVI